MFFPARRFLRAILVRSTILWVGIRFAMAWFDVVRFTPLAVAFLLGAVIAAVLADAHKRNEALLLANLGYSRWPVAVTAGAWTLLLELGLAWALVAAA